jgi:hypothetical protein
MNQVILTGSVSNFIRYTTKDGSKDYVIFDLTASSGGANIKIKCYCELGKEYVNAKIAYLESKAATGTAYTTIVGCLRMKETKKCVSYSIQVKKFI